MRVVLGVVLVLVACGPSGRSAPPSNRGNAPAQIEDPMWHQLRDEWQLLHDLMAIEPPTSIEPALGALAEHYQQRGAWDEYSTARARLLELAPKNIIPAPGGPFPRIGAPRDGARPATLLGRWLNDKDLPELYGKPEVTPIELALSLRERLGGADQAQIKLRLGDALCAQLAFRAAIGMYREAVAEGNLPRAADRAADVERILRGPGSAH